MDSEDAERLLAARVRRMSAYAPITPVETIARRIGAPLDSIVKLDANENPYGPSPRAIAALAQLSDAHRYPDPDQIRLRAAIAAFTGLPVENLICGAGADELLQLVGMAFIEPGDGLIDLPPTFGMYRWVADITGADYVAVRRDAAFRLDRAAIERAVAAHPRAKLMFVTHPNNPDGALADEGELRALAELPLILVIDEAYIDFATRPSLAGWALERPNVIVLRTFSKLAGLAGMRAGYGVYHTSIAAHLWKLKQPYTPTAATSAALIAALEDRGHLEDTRAQIVAERERMRAELTALGWLAPFPSEANFLLCRITGRPPTAAGVSAGRALRDALEAQGIMVRYFDREGLRDCIRISVGRPQDTDALMDALKRISGM
jgi:histidinol-phosphate aminotransferase